MLSYLNNQNIKYGSHLLFENKNKNESSIKNNFMVFKKAFEILQSMSLFPRFSSHILLTFKIPHSKSPPFIQFPKCGTLSLHSRPDFTASIRDLSESPPFPFY